jgi:hypothetical protein
LHMGVARQKRWLFIGMDMISREQVETAAWAALWRWQRVCEGFTLSTRVACSLNMKMMAICHSKKARHPKWKRITYFAYGPSTKKSPVIGI